MNRIALTTALVLSMAAPAFASDQLAKQLNVDPGVYTTAELVSLRNAIENDDHAAANAIRGNPGGFDYKRYSLFHGITHQVFLKQDEFEVLDEKNESRFKNHQP